MTSIYVKPADGGRVRMPEQGSRVMPSEGASVPRNSYYETLLTQGDVVECEAPTKTPAKPVKGSAKDTPPADENSAAK